MITKNRLELENEQSPHLYTEKLIVKNKRFSLSFGFTLVELLVAISIIAILSTVGIAIFSNATSKARDTQRKSDLRQIQSALELYYENKSEYPKGNGINESNQQLCINVDDELVEYLKSAPSDPSDKSMKYCYQATTDGKKYALFARLENCDEANVNQNKCNQQNDALTYKITSDETFIVQAPTPVTPREVNPVIPHNVPESSFERPTSADLPPTCNGFDIREQHTSGTIYTYEKIYIKPKVTISSNFEGDYNIRVFQSKYPGPLLSAPYTSSDWKEIGSAGRRYECIAEDPDQPDGCQTYGYRIYPFQGEIERNMPEYPGVYTLAMEFYDQSGNKLAGWENDRQKCTKNISIEPQNQECSGGNRVYPTGVISSVRNNDVMIQWVVANSNGVSNDNATAYYDTQPISETAPPSTIMGENDRLNYAIKYDLQPGNYYTRVKVSNACGTGWSENIQFKIP